MLSPALHGRSQVISNHLRALGILIYGTVGYMAIVEKNHVLIKWNETERDDDSEATRHGGLRCGSIPVWVVLGLIRCTSLSHVKRSLTLSWPDKSFWPQSRVIQFRPGIGGSSAYSGGSKDVLGDTGMRPRGVKVPITWQSVALGDALSVEPTLS
jgi:hypothetical protein